MKIEIEVPAAKGSPQAIAAIETIAANLTVQNLFAVAEKLKNNADKVNKKLPTGLKFI
ncbi:MAG: hypothetical protein M9892_07610 [Bacteroidetes bacterium]|nr:hypothetical protein [Bacteroidota bacterium]